MLAWQPKPDPKTPGTLAVSAHSGAARTPEELAKFLGPLEYDETPAAVADCDDFDPSHSD
jgi:hypothetical protein